GDEGMGAPREVGKGCDPAVARQPPTPVDGTGGGAAGAAGRGVTRRPARPGDGGDPADLRGAGAMVPHSGAGRAADRAGADSGGAPSLLLPLRGPPGARGACRPLRLPDRSTDPD